MLWKREGRTPGLTKPQRQSPPELGKEGCRPFTAQGAATPCRDSPDQWSAFCPQQALSCLSPPSDAKAVVTVPIW